MLPLTDKPSIFEELIATVHNTSDACILTKMYRESFRSVILRIVHCTVLKVFVLAASLITAINLRMNAHLSNAQCELSFPFAVLAFRFGFQCQSLGLEFVFCLTLFKMYNSAVASHLRSNIKLENFEQGSIDCGWFLVAFNCKFDSQLIFCLFTFQIFNATRCLFGIG